MKKNWLTAIALLLLSGNVFSQTLFTYGPQQVEASEFLRAFNKNNQEGGDRSAALKEYLQLYINSRLRIQEAYDRRFDTLPQVLDEVNNLRTQIVSNYMSDPEAVKRLTGEAFQRSLKDIHVAHIFISLPEAGSRDTAAAFKRLGLVQKRLAAGEDFLKLAKEVSDDPNAAVNSGDLSYITVFSLPYEYENIVYATKPGKYSKAYRSNHGYHIFKNLGERKALGKLRLQQILLAFPPGSGEDEKQVLSARADSLYQLIQKGGNFSELAEAFSNDAVSSHAGGMMPEAGIGQYDPVFEKQAWAITSDGAVAKPFETSHGFHIVKRISAKPVISDSSDTEYRELLSQQVMNDDRWKTARDFIYAKVRSKAGFKTLYSSPAALWGITDSLLNHQPAGAGRGLSPESPVFQLGDSIIPVKTWINYYQMNGFRPGQPGKREYASLLDEMSKQLMYEYYRDHLEAFNPEFKYQMSEFRDGNMFFEIMQQEIWSKAQSDSVELEKLYARKKDDYRWKESAEAVVFFCADSAIAAQLYERIKAAPKEWKTEVEKLNEKVVADSARYELEQIPGLKGAAAAGSMTGIINNPIDNTASFAYILKVHSEPSLRSFAEARGLVMSDYQALLEERWNKELRQKYPVKINQQVLEKIARN